MTRKKNYGNKKDGKELEILIAKIENTLSSNDDFLVEHNVKIPDKSGVKRQFDVVIWDRSDERQVFMSLVECKDYSKPLGLEYIDDFIGKVARFDNVKQKIIVSTSGVNDSVMKRADYNNIKVFKIDKIDEGDIASWIEDENRMIRY